MLKPVYQHIYQGDLPPKAGYQPINPDKEKAVNRRLELCGYQPVAIGSARLYMNPPISNRVFRLVESNTAPWGPAIFVVVNSGDRWDRLSVYERLDIGGRYTWHVCEMRKSARDIIWSKQLYAACLMRGELVGVNLELLAGSIYSGGF